MWYKLFISPPPATSLKTLPNFSIEEDFSKIFHRNLNKLYIHEFSSQRKNYIIVKKIFFLKKDTKTVQRINFFKYKVVEMLQI